MFTTAQTDLDFEARLDLITRGLGKIDDLAFIQNTLQEKNTPTLFWGVAPTGRPHIGYLVPFVKLAEAVEAGLEIKILLADIYAFLVNYKYPLPVVEQRTNYYKYSLAALFEAINGRPSSAIQFQLQSTHCTTKEYTLDLFKILSLTSQADARSPNDELRNTKMLSPLLCPLLQALDEPWMRCDFTLGGLDQAGYFDYTGGILSKIGYNDKCGHLLNQMLPGLRGTKMSASDPRSKIDLLDDPETVCDKISNSICKPGMIEDNPILALLRVVLIPISRLRLARCSSEVNDPICECSPYVGADAPEGSIYSIEIQNGSLRHYRSYEEIESDFLSGAVSAAALKGACAKGINQLLSHIRKSFERSLEWQDSLNLGYGDDEKTNEAPVTRPASDNFCIPAALKEISNDRIKLTPFSSTRHAAEFVAVANQHPDVWSHGPFGPFDSAQSFISDFIESFIRPNTGIMLYAVIDKTQSPKAGGSDREGALAGIIALCNTSLAMQVTEIAFVFTLPPFQKTHVTTNAVGLLLNFTLNPPEDGGLGLRRVQWTTSSVNENSIVTAEKMGFMKEGVMRWAMVYPGGKTKGKPGNGKSLESPQGHLNQDDLGRDSVVLSMCWDDWLINGKKDFVARRMARRN
ncbi:hypothetical protein TWF225_012054 [Orbilia oligospora]|uniref:tyrosine--tRNA ligase n=1 Tax=Orbilia oligospora TaxID=2813651 RepID=A0A7C8KFT9_ORBOL|nr:hypothetical protein TWF225_012054 [Orbilia oligospora]KAF3174839.1 hypothetical protein TWF751_004594 [Orbilia oligospora]KAF3236482.1 hypothetical protein TWF128_001350 [Orbilia oligospora]KAF3266137.1 hypothetical protein TWF217_001821 [Orbilia oligospora]KAF3297204.1 hypothetical protein TWF132_008558 [Orbilia oligospora]